MWRNGLAAVAQEVTYRILEETASLLAGEQNIPLPVNHECRVRRLREGTLRGGS
jgi:hypothetical protein